jgi:energy-coupling factor transport system substrate-specific component
MAGGAQNAQGASGTQKARQFLGLKDVILVTLLTALCILICTVIVLPFAANLQLVLWAVGGLDLLVCGPIYILMCARAPRYGTQLLFSFLFAVYYYFTNGMILISLMIVTIGVVRELMMLKDGYYSPVRLTAAFTLFGIGVMLAPVILLKTTADQVIATMLASGLSQEYVDGMLAVYSAGNIAIGIALTIVGGILGCFIGYRMLRKHFKPAGVA